jgi:hypothetical protein
MVQPLNVAADARFLVKLEAQDARTLDLRGSEKSLMISARRNGVVNVPACEGKHGNNHA